MLLRYGPSPINPVPKGSIIICWHCSIPIGRLNEDIHADDSVYPYLQMDFIEEPELGCSGYCLRCGNSVFSSGRLMHYFPIEGLPSRIVYFMMGLSPLAPVTRGSVSRL